MLGYWSFEIAPRVAKRDRTFVLFCSAQSPDAEAVALHIERYCNTHFIPDRIFLIAPSSERDAMAGVLASTKFQGRINAATRHSDPPVAECLLFDAEGNLVNINERGNVPGDIEAMKRIGLTCLVRERHVFRSAPASHHFAVPSGGHAQAFFRAGDAMVDGAAIDFMAYCCLRYVPLGLRHIFCDSGTISPVAFAISALRTRLNKLASVASVGSFESYPGLMAFPFPSDMSQSVVLISLTTTGGLAPLLCRTHPAITPAAVIHLFALCDIPEHKQVVCDLRQHPQDNPEGFEEVTTYPAGKCQLCDRKSSLIRISSDQFLPGDIEVKPLRLVVSHKPDWLDPFLKRVVGKKIIKANYRTANARHATSEVFFDLQTLFSSPAMLGIEFYESRLRWLFHIAVPAMLNRIVCLDGESSGALARLFAEHVRPKLGDIAIYTFTELQGLGAEHVHTDGATLVVAGAAASGRSLMSVSRKLRDLQTNGAITYVIGVPRFPTVHMAKEVESNLTIGEHSRKFGYYVLEPKVYLPLVGSKEKTYWEDEKDLIISLQNTCEDVAARALLDDRIESLRNASSREVRGMENDVFWPRRDGEPLALRRGFAFFSFDVPPATSQADVFFTIVAILHDLRHRNDADASLVQHEHVHRVLSPRCFDRFNDGLIQSCILRAALPIELDYSASEVLSVQMKQVLEWVLSEDTADGEASREFLLALALGHLRIRPEELSSLKTSYSDGRGDPIAKLLWTKIGE